MTAQPAPRIEWLRCPRCGSQPTSIAAVVDDEEPLYGYGLRCCVRLARFAATAAEAERTALIAWSQCWPETDRDLDLRISDIDRHHRETRDGTRREGW
jgi:hypothetical protein